MIQVFYMVIAVCPLNARISGPLQSDSQCQQHVPPVTYSTKEACHEAWKALEIEHGEDDSAYFVLGCFPLLIENSKS